MQAFLTPSGFRINEPKRKIRGATCIMTPEQSGKASSTSRRNFLKAMSLAPLAFTDIGLSSPADASVLIQDRLYDAKSGSFVPVGSVGQLLRRDLGKAYNRCIVAGEVHDNICTHQAQLAVIESARQLPDQLPLTLGLEMFYRHHNPILRDYVQKRITLEEMLWMTDWNNTWGFDAKLYAPIFEYCRSHDIPMFGLNVPFEIVRMVGIYGLDGVPEKIKRILPDNMDIENRNHFEHFMKLMGWDGGPTLTLHGHSADQKSVMRYYEAQVLWEEWMSQSVALSLYKYPQTRMVALIGTGHVEGRYGFPDRIEKRCNQRPYTIVPKPVSWDAGNGFAMPNINTPERDIADVVWYTRRKIDLV